MEAAISQLKTAATDLDAAINERVAADKPATKASGLQPDGKVATALASAAGIGSVTAATLVALLPELGRISGAESRPWSAWRHSTTTAAAATAAAGLPAAAPMRAWRRHGGAASHRAPARSIAAWWRAAATEGRPDRLHEETDRRASTPLAPPEPSGRRLQPNRRPRPALGADRTNAQQTGGAHGLKAAAAHRAGTRQRAP